MTQSGIREYVEAIRERYLWATKKEKGRILDEATRVTGYHRKALIRLVHRGHKGLRRGRRGRPRKYGPGVVQGLRAVWEATDRICSKRLQPFLPELIPIVRRHGERSLTMGVELQLLRMSPSTIDRLLRPYRHRCLRRPFSTTKPGSLLKAAIPIRTFADWNEDRPGFIEVDLVAHCGESTKGFYLNTLCAVDVATGWVECQGVWGKGQQTVGSAVHHISRRLPFPLLGLDSDNGSEFINHHLLDYCRGNQITFTRSRPYKKNDSAHVEQKNWSVVRRLVGYDRYNNRKALEALNRIYLIVSRYTNFFQPVMKLKHKTRHGAKVHKVYDQAQTPYQRLLARGVLSEVKRRQLVATYAGLSPVLLLNQLNENLQYLWALAQHLDGKPMAPKRTVTV